MVWRESTEVDSHCFPQVPDWWSSQPKPFTGHAPKIWLLLPRRETRILDNRRVTRDPYPLVGAASIFTMEFRSNVSNLDREACRRAIPEKQLHQQWDSNLRSATQCQVLTVSIPFKLWSRLLVTDSDGVSHGVFGWHLLLQSNWLPWIDDKISVVAPDW